MPVSYQEFKFGAVEKKLNLVSSKVPQEPQFIYLPAALKAFKIHDVVGFEDDGELEADGVTIDYMRDDNGAMYYPKRIPCCPGCVIEVIYMTPQSDSTSLASTIAPRSLMLLNESVDQLSIQSVATPVKVKPGFESVVIRKLDGLHDQGDITQKIAQEVLKLSKEMNDRLILIESKTAAILTQNYELLEYTIPRLFIVLPDTSTRWDPVNMLRTKFRLHFICECGEHTKATTGAGTNHEGYVVNKPTEFFQKYGPFLMLMLKMIKVGTTIAGHVVPALASLKVVDILDSTQSTIDSVTSKVVEGVDYSLKCLEESRTLIRKSDDVDVDGNARMLQQDLATYLAGVEGLEGVDLRQLGSYLSTNSSDNLLGNLYRMTTKDGHVKWVCRDHYRAGYQEAHTQKLRDVVKLSKGKFDEQLGRVEITLKSSFAAVEFYDAVSKAKGVLDLYISLDWDQQYADFVKLEDMVSKSNIRSIKVCLDFHKGPNIDINLSGRRRYDPIFGIMRLPSIESFKIMEIPKDFFQRSSPLPGNADLSNLKLLHIGLYIKRHYRLAGAAAFLRHWSAADIAKIESLVAQAPNLISKEVF
ncbi:hypothetical protein EDD21DRAFT_403109 [Dissophora ornata]|nr:hypothetical protein EDD21DRAFT_403109 [Dissophora ornata]